MGLLDWLGLRLGGGPPQGLEEAGVEELRTPEELDHWLARHEDGPAFLFKHSTSCPISSGAYQQVAQFVEDAGLEAAPVALIKVIQSRALSNEIALRFGVTHQSPQVLLIRDGGAVWDASHSRVTAKAMIQAVTRTGG